MLPARVGIPIPIPQTRVNANEIEALDRQTRFFLLSSFRPPGAGWYEFSMHHQKRAAVHLPVKRGAHRDGKPEPAHGAVHIHGHGIGGRPGHARFVAGPPVAGALPAEAALVHEQ